MNQEPPMLQLGEDVRNCKIVENDISTHNMVKNPKKIKFDPIYVGLDIFKYVEKNITCRFQLIIKNFRIKAEKVDWA